MLTTGQFADAGPALVLQWRLDVPEHRAGGLLPRLSEPLTRWRPKACPATRSVAVFLWIDTDLAHPDSDVPPGLLSVCCNLSQPPTLISPCSASDIMLLILYVRHVNLP